MLRKIFSGILSTLLVLTVLTTAFNISLIKTGSSIDLPHACPLVYVYPDSFNTDVGGTFTISVIAYNLTDATITDPDNPFSTVPLGNLYGFDFQFTWDPTVIKYVNSTKPDKANGGYRHPNVTTPVEKYLNPIPPSPYHGILHGFGSGNQTLLEVKNVVNETGNIVGAVDPSVRAWFAFATMLPAWAFNGNGTLFTMKFKVLKRGASPLNIVDVTLADVNGSPIGRTSSGRWLNPPRNGQFRTLQPPVANFTHTPEVGKINETMHFNASISENSSNIAKYMWNFGDGAKQNTTIPTVNYIYRTGGTFPASLKVVDVNGRESNTTTHNIQVIGTLQISDVHLTSTLMAEANITCPGVTNVTELVDNVTLNFWIDGTWYMKPMTYNSQSHLYTALIPAYNQLANKTINYYVALRDKQSHILTSPVVIYHVPEWVIADLNRDGRVTILDIVKACLQYGKP